MTKKIMAGFTAAAVVLLSGSLVKVNADPPEAPGCSFYLKAPDGTISSNTVYVGVDKWEYLSASSSGASVKPASLTIFNNTGRDITINEDRWENANGSTIERGTGGTIHSGKHTVPWYPKTYIPTSQGPYIGVTAYATSRPGLNGSTRCKPPQ